MTENTNDAIDEDNDDDRLHIDAAVANHDITTDHADVAASIDSDDDEGDAANHETITSDDDDDGEPTVTTPNDDGAPKMPDFTQSPAHRFRILHAINARQYGYSTCKGADWFTNGFMGSLHAVERLEIMYKMDEEHTGCVNCLHFNDSGTKLVSGDDNGKIVVWNWAINRPQISFESGHVLNVFQAKFMPLSGDCHIVSTSRDGQVRLAELSVRGVCKSTRRLARHSAAAHKLALDPCSPHVFLSAGEDGVVFEIDLRSAEAANKILVVKNSNHRRVPLYSVHNNPNDAHYFCVCGRDTKVRIYDKRKLSPSSSLPVCSYCPHHLLDASTTHDANVTSAVYNYNGTEILASYNDDDIYTFDATNQSDGADYTHRYIGHRNSQTVKSVNYYGPKSEFIVSGSDCGNVYFWEHDSEKICQVKAADEGGVVNVLEPHPYAAILATSGLDHDVKIWVPSDENPGLDYEKVWKLTKKNARLRSRDRRNPDPDADFIYSMLRRIIRDRSNRRRSHANREDDDDDDDDDGTVMSHGSGTSSDDQDDESTMIISGDRTSMCRTS